MLKELYSEHLDIVKERTWPKFMQPMRFVKMLPSYPNVTPVPVRFVANIDPPIPAADAIVRKLMIATELVNDCKFILIGQDLHFSQYDVSIY